MGWSLEETLSTISKLGEVVERSYMEKGDRKEVTGNREQAFSCGGGYPHPGKEKKGDGTEGRRRVGASGGLRIPVRSFVASGVARVEEAKDELVRMGRVDSG